MERVDAFLIAAKRYPREVFVSRFPGFFFLVEPFAPVEAPSVATLGSENGAGSPHAVARVEKRRGANTFDWMITVGRSPNNDIVLPVSDVSKFHAMLREEDGAWTLTDAGSTFGTVVTGRKLEAQHPAPIRPGDDLQLGSVALTFHSSATLFDALRRHDL